MRACDELDRQKSLIEFSRNCRLRFATLERQAIAGQCDAADGTIRTICDDIVKFSESLRLRPE